MARNVEMSRTQTIQHYIRQNRRNSGGGRGEPVVSERQKEAAAKLIQLCGGLPEAHKAIEAAVLVADIANGSSRIPPQ